MPHADLSAGRFFYRDQGEGPVVVFTHGFLLDHEMFEPQVAELQNHYRCIVWDQRLHGRTEVVGEHTFWDSANDELELMDHLGVDAFFHVGMSQGGFIGLRVALTAPERVKGLVFIDSQAGLENPDTLPMYESMIEQWIAGIDRPGLALTTAQIIVGAGVDPDYWVAKFLDRDPETLPVIFRTLVERDDLHARLGEISCPALVLHGAEDMAIGLDQAEALAEGLPNCGPVQVIEGAGHSANLADPLAVNAALGEFLRANS